MLDPSKVDLVELANALSDQNFDHRWRFSPETGEILLLTEDDGIDGETDVDPDELNHVPIDPVPSHVWYRDMADFAVGLSDEGAGRRLARAIQGRGAFRRFKDELHEEYPELVQVWYAFRDTRAKRRAIEWLVDNSLVDEAAADRLLEILPDPDLP